MRCSVTRFCRSPRSGGPNAVDADIEKGIVYIYPNPFTEVLYFSNLWKIPLSKIEIYDERGRLVLSEQVKSGSVNTASLSSGVYFAAFVFSDGSVIHKKIKK